MKIFNRLVLLFVLMSVFLISCRVEEEYYYFRNSKWNMTEEEIVKSEGREPEERRGHESKALVYDNIDFLGNKYSVEYILMDDKLHDAYYDFTFPDYANWDIEKRKSEVRDKYQEILSQMIEFYGEPDVKGMFIYDGASGIKTIESHDFETDEDVYCFSTEWTGDMLTCSHGNKGKRVVVLCGYNDGRISIEYITEDTPA